MIVQYVYVLCAAQRKIYNKRRNFFFILENCNLFEKLKGFPFSIIILFLFYKKKRDEGYDVEWVKINDPKINLYTEIHTHTDFFFIS